MRHLDRTKLCQNNLEYFLFRKLGHEQDRHIQTFSVHLLLFRYLLLSCSIVLFGLTTARLNKTTTTTTTTTTTRHADRQTDAIAGGKILKNDTY